MKDALIIGAGFAGATLARKLAEGGYKVRMVETRANIAGNMFDYTDENGIIVQQFGPHIFHTNLTHVFDFLNTFAAFMPYEHKVVGSIDGKMIPIPFNLQSIDLIYDAEMADRLKTKLIDRYGLGKKIPITELKREQDPELHALADFIYHKVFRNYTMKQWGMLPEELDPEVMTRVPVHISYDCRYFQDEIQQMPEGGFTPLFAKMLDHDNIEIQCNQDAKDCLRFAEANEEILVDGQVFDGVVIFTGCVDELFEQKHGALPYRSIDFQFETHSVRQYQEAAVVNYPNEHAFTRITEFKHFTGPVDAAQTTIMYEFSELNGPLPCYPIPHAENESIVKRYQREAAKYKNLHLIGRLAEYKYYNMDQVVHHALQLAERILQDD
ncbi:MAG: UDP-galactopyranose mutase [Clostridia bacterium]